jgi:hypothetical protein
MTGFRVLKVATVCAFLVLVTTAWVFRFNSNGYSQTLGSLRTSFGDGAYIFIALFSVGSLVSMAIFGIAGVIGMAASRRLGRSALILGLLCCALSFANFLLWKNYRGVPTHDSGYQPVQSTMKIAGGPNQHAHTQATAP